MKTIRIRDEHVPAIEHFAVVDVDISAYGLSMFKMDKLRDDVSSAYIVLDFKEARKLLEFLIKELPDEGQVMAQYEV
jgi:hypothetical protein